MDTFFQDLRYALRMLRKAPGFTAVAVLTLALGIGANSAIFTVIDSVLLRPLQYKDADRLVYLNEESKQLKGMSVAYLNFQDWQSQNQVFERMGASQGNAFVLTRGEQPELVFCRSVTEGFFPTLGITPTLGREILASDDQPSAGPVALLSYGLWQRRFGGNPNIIGTALNLDGKAYTVVGVLPKGFEYLGNADDVYVPLGLQAKDFTDRGNHPGIYAVGRLKPGVTLDQARAEMNAIAQRLAQAYPISNRGNGINLRSMQEVVVGNIRPWLLILFAAVGLVLLIACANVANLLLTRATIREREIAIRTALGAARARMIRQLLTESLLLAFLGGVLGMALAILGIHLLTTAAPDSLPRVAEIHINAGVLGFTLLASLLTGAIFGLVPALHVSAPQLQQALREGARGSTTGGGQRVRSALVISELALSLVLLVAAGLLIRSFIRLLDVNPGFNADKVFTARIALPDTKYKDIPQVENFFDQLLRNLSAMPNVQSVGTITPLPFTGEGWQADYRIEDRPTPEVGEFPNTDIHYVSPAYLQTMQIPLLSGRAFTDSDNDSNLPVAIVNQTFARRWWPNQNPIGKRIRLCGTCTPRPDREPPPWLTVVGLVGDVRQYGLDQEPKTEVYTPYNQHGGRTRALTYRALVLRTATNDPLTMTNEVRSAVQQIDKDLPIFSIRTMEQLIGNSVASRKLSMFLLISFAGLALLLAAVGLYGVISYSVTQRTQEIGIRMALGASQRDVLAMVVTQASRLAAIGLGIGLVLALALAGLISKMLFGVRPSDPLTFACILLLLAAVALLASYIPARRASKVDPMIALRYE
jgi:putative ABC transport system permease protein